ncbi:hypothetical protein V1264_005252 [Littorina saxatilis]|uniref:Uncharacterized protein n=1 Tax=Littorina saxatilis TaxID=31220 RepID=A0AAN9G597_9CAEN
MSIPHTMNGTQKDGKLMNCAKNRDGQISKRLLGSRASNFKKVTSPAEISLARYIPQLICSVNMALKLDITTKSVVFDQNFHLPAGGIARPFLLARRIFYSPVCHGRAIWPSLFKVHLEVYQQQKTEREDTLLCTKTFTISRNDCC